MTVLKSCFYAQGCSEGPCKNGVSPCRETGNHSWAPLQELQLKVPHSNQWDGERHRRRFFQRSSYFGVQEKGETAIPVAESPLYSQHSI
jgi:hypothetical protein